MERELLTQPNERRCEYTYETHIMPLYPACPYSGNPQKGSRLFISYMPKDLILEVIALRQYIDSYTGGKGEIRSMEGMVQAIAKDCANACNVECTVIADLIISPDQLLKLKCKAKPTK